MTTAQKVIKYLAIAFAIFLIITIISGILGTLFALSGILGLKKHIEENSTAEMVTTTFENSEITELDIDLEFTNLTIKIGDVIKIETDNNNIDCRQNDEELHIQEKNRKLFVNNTEKELILYLPENIELEKVKINTGAGRTEIQSLNVLKKCKIECGAGEITILSGTINDLDLDMGVGEASITANLTGQSEINAGIGEININLQGNKDNYKIKADKGIGSIKIDKKEISNGEIYGDGENYIEVDGGIGRINIKYLSTKL